MGWRGSFPETSRETPLAKTFYTDDSSSCCYILSFQKLKGRGIGFHVRLREGKVQHFWGSPEKDVNLKPVCIRICPTDMPCPETLKSKPEPFQRLKRQVLDLRGSQQVANKLTVEGARVQVAGF